MSKLCSNHRHYLINHPPPMSRAPCRGTLPFPRMANSKASSSLSVALTIAANLGPPALVSNKTYGCGGNATGPDRPIGLINDHQARCGGACRGKEEVLLRCWLGPHGYIPSGKRCPVPGRPVEIDLHAGVVVGNDDRSIAPTHGMRRVIVQLYPG